VLDTVAARLNPDHDEMTPWSELFLYEAARAQHIDQVVRPLLKKGTTVLCDRFSDATLAYQGYGRHLDLGWIRRLNRLSSQNVKPDLTFLLDCPSKVGLKRALERSRTSKGDRFERKGLIPSAVKRVISPLRNGNGEGHLRKGPIRF
jgi:dTMP kinase